MTELNKKYIIPVWCNGNKEFKNYGKISHYKKLFCHQWLKENLNRETCFGCEEFIIEIKSLKKKLKRETQRIIFPNTLNEYDQSFKAIKFSILIIIMFLFCLWLSLK